jgi:hypothetical protein
MGAAITGTVLASLNYSRNNDQDWLLQMQDLKDMVLMMNVTELGMELELQALKDMILMMNVTDLRALLDSLGNQDANSTAALIAKDMVLMGNVTDLDTRIVQEGSDRLAKDMMLMDDVAALQAKDMVLMSNVSSLDSRLAQETSDRIAKDMQLMDDVADLQDKSFVLMVNVSSLDARLTQEAVDRDAKDMTLMTDVTDLQNKDMTLMSDITALQNKDMTLMNDISMLQSKDMTLMSQIAAINNVTSTLIINGTVQDVKLMSLMTDAMALEDRVDMNEDRSNNNTVKIIQNMMDINTLQTTALTNVVANNPTISVTAPTPTTRGISVNAPSLAPAICANPACASSGVSGITGDTGCPTFFSGNVRLNAPDPYLVTTCTAPTNSINVFLNVPALAPALVPTLAPNFAPSSTVSGVTALRLAAEPPTSTTSPTGAPHVVAIGCAGTATCARAGNTITITTPATSGITQVNTNSGSATPSPTGQITLQGTGGITVSGSGTTINIAPPPPTPAPASGITGLQGNGIFLGSPSLSLTTTATTVGVRGLSAVNSINQAGNGIRTLTETGAITVTNKWNLAPGYDIHLCQVNCNPCNTIATGELHRVQNVPGYLWRDGNTRHFSTNAGTPTGFTIGVGVSFYFVCQGNVGTNYYSSFNGCNPMTPGGRCTCATPTVGSIACAPVAFPNIPGSFRGTYPWIIGGLPFRWSPASPSIVQRSTIAGGANSPNEVLGIQFSYPDTT